MNMALFFQLCVEFFYPMTAISIARNHNIPAESYPHRATLCHSYSASHQSISQDIGHTDTKCVSKTSLALPPFKDKKILGKIFKKSPYCYSSEGIPKFKPIDIPKSHNL